MEVKLFGWAGREMSAGGRDSLGALLVGGREKARGAVFGVRAILYSSWVNEKKG